MLSAAAVLVCALNALGRSEESFPPIRLIDERPPYVTQWAEAFVGRGPDTIYVLTSSSAFREAARNERGCWGHDSFKKLASILIHEEWHIRHGTDERGAYLAQLTALGFMRVQTDSALFHSVRKAMVKAVEGQNRARQVEAILASREPR